MGNQTEMWQRCFNLFVFFVCFFVFQGAIVGRDEREPNGVETATGGAGAGRGGGGGGGRGRGAGGGAGERRRDAGRRRGRTQRGHLRAPRLQELRHGQEARPRLAQPRHERQTRHHVRHPFPTRIPSLLT